MSRFTALWKASPRKVLLALGGLLVVAALAIGSGAAGRRTACELPRGAACANGGDSGTQERGRRI